ncbi:MAG: glycerophosphodiester phosphodiesterase [Spirochaetales bacterium]
MFKAARFAAWRRRLVVVGVTTVAVSGLLAGCAGQAGRAGEPADYVFVQAHRGASDEYPELTLAAFEGALEAGADRIEMDLAITEDDHIVLVHDSTVDRTTDGSGRVAGHTLDELKQLDAGSWHSSRFEGEEIPTLEEVLELVDGKATVNLEVKTSGRSGTEVNRTVERAIEIVKEHEALDWVFFSSFDRFALDEVRSVEPEARLMLIDWNEPSSYSGLDVAINNDYFGWTPSREYATQERIERAEEAGLSVHTGASPGRELHDLVSWGIDGFSSDDPEALVDFLERHGYREGEAGGR